MSNEADIIVVAQASKRLGKRFIVEGETYIKPSGDLKETNIDMLYRFNAVEGINTLDKLYALRCQLASETRSSLVLGHPTESFHDVVNEIHEDAADQTVTNITKFIPRSDKYLVDGRSRFLVLDIDELELEDYDAIIDAPDTINRLYELFDIWGLDWLITDCVLHFSSSHALIKRNAIKAHFTVELDRPLNLAEQKAVAGYINEKAQSHVVDTAIYEPRRLLFTSESEFLKRSPKDGRLRRTRAPNLFQRVVLNKMGGGVAEVPNEALRFVEVDDHIRAVTGATGVEKPRRLEPGNVHDYIKSTIHATVFSTPSHEVPAVKRALRERLLAEVRTLEYDKNKQEDRESKAAGKEFERLWRGSERLLRKAKKVAGGGRAIGNADVGKGRAELASILHNAVKVGVEGNYERHERKLMTPRIATHTLIKSPPGMGKSEQALNAIQPEYAEDLRIFFLTPTVNLSSEILGRLLDKITDEELIRLHKGRAKLCTADEQTQELADKVERAGLRAREIVCKQCPLYEECPWPPQALDTNPGVIISQHANLSTAYQTMQEDREPAVTIIDEAMFAQVLPQAVEKSHDTIAKEINETKVMSRGKLKTLREATADLIADRTALIEAIKTNSGGVSLSSLRRLTHALDRSNVSKLRRHFWAEEACRIAWIDHRDRTGEYIKEAGTSRGYEEDLTRASRAISTCEWFIDVIEIIMTSVDVPDREEALGLEHKGGIVYSCRRKPMPSAVMQSDAIYLDGTADEDIFRACLRDTAVMHTNKVVKTVDVQPKNYVLTQYTTKPFGKTFFLGSDGKRDSSNLLQFRMFIIRKAQEHKQLLVVTQLDVKKAIQDIGPMPDNVKMEHFNNLRGLDEYRDYEAAIVAGRPAPPKMSLELMAAALHYDNDDVKSIKRVTEYYTEKARLPLRGGGSIEIDAESHPDPHVRAIMRQVSDAEVQQAIHRLRLYDREEYNPAHLYVFGQIDTGLLIDHQAEWVDIKTTSAETYGILTQSPYLCQLIGEKIGRKERAVRQQLEAPFKESPLPLFKARLNGKLIGIKIAAPEEAAKKLGVFGEVKDLRPA